MSLDLYDFPRLEPPLEATRAVMGAVDVVAAAEAQADAIRAEAAARGREEGLAMAGDVLGPARDALLAAVAGVEALREELETAAELRSIELAVAIARKVVGAALTADPALVAEVVQGALRATTARERLVVEVNPDDVDLVRDAIGEPAARLGVGRLEVVGERRVARGGCLVRMGDGEIDGTVGEQLARAEEVLREAFAARRADG